MLTLQTDGKVEAIITSETLTRRTGNIHTQVEQSGDILITPIDEVYHQVKTYEEEAILTNSDTYSNQLEHLEGSLWIEEEIPQNTTDATSKDSLPSIEEYYDKSVLTEEEENIENLQPNIETDEAEFPADKKLEMGVSA